MRNGEYPLRTHEETMNFAAIAEYRGTPIMGIKGVSVFSKIDGFNVASGLDLDFFHALKPYSLSKQFEKVNARLLGITPTTDISRAPRSLKDRLDWRGHEWVHWVVEYSVPVLKNILPARFLNHWSHLVWAVAVLMQNSVDKSDVAYAARYLHKFVGDIDRLYGIEHMTISIHLLTHLGDSVFNFGQPWTHSAFSYESFNNDIKMFVKSSNGMAKQIWKGMQLRVALKNLEEDVGACLTPSQKDYFNKMTITSIRCQVEPHQTIGDVSFLGRPKSLILSALYLKPLKDKGLPCKDLVIYERCLFQGDVYHSSNYARVSKQNNSVVLLDGNDVFCIEHLIVATDQTITFACINVLQNEMLK
ncbi:hypothetical protein FOCC_FOCC008348 [Frankliniella occidentalis]|nr:hypothetical protein FOCC_FOCC008348 [Frankliniella occidentalis]